MASKLATSDLDGNVVAQGAVVDGMVVNNTVVDGAVAQSASVLDLAQGDIVGRVQRAFANSGVFSLRDLTVELIDERLFLSGTVGSFYHKQLAQETVRAVAGAVEVVNSVRVLSVR